MSENELRWQLRQLPRELEPGRDLWPAIAQRLPASKPKPHRHWLLSGLALAASLALAVGVGLRLPPPVAAEQAQARMLQAETDAMVREFEAALIQLEHLPMPGELQADIDTLDRSADAIRQALRSAPGSTLLVDHLRRTYALRLSLTQRAATS
ncbi:MAG TPA: hypothetical protein VFY12_01285 [Arenimonas sp.]|nr:hypothetical protein [Arenimonas sp.]